MRAGIEHLSVHVQLARKLRADLFIAADYHFLGAFARDPDNVFPAVVKNGMVSVVGKASEPFQRLVRISSYDVLKKLPDLCDVFLDDLSHYLCSSSFLVS